MNRAGALQFLNRGTAWNYNTNRDASWTNNGLSTVTFGNVVDASAEWRVSVPYALRAPRPDARFWAPMPLSSNLYSLNSTTISFRYRITTTFSATGIPLLFLGGPATGIATRGVIVQQLNTDIRVFFAASAGQTLVTLSGFPAGVWRRFVLTRDASRTTTLFVDDVSRAVGTYDISDVLASDRLYVLSTGGATSTSNTNTFLTDLTILRNDSSTIPAYRMTGNAPYL
jgi:hypothetical protein